MQDIQLSIIIPIFNAEKYLNYCLKSLEGLADKAEIIMVDDGSTDQSVEICNYYIKKHSSYIYISKKNGGPSSARNRGIEIARGKWITFVDADDWICSETYIKVLEKVSDDIDIFYFTSEYVKEEKEILDYKDGKACGEFLPYKVKMGLLNSDSTYIKKYIKRGFIFHGPVAKFYKREVITSNNVRFPENLSWGEDIYFNYIILGYVSKLMYVETIGYYYRKNNESIMNSYKPNKSKQMLELMTMMHRIVVNEPEVMDAYYKMGVRQYLYALKLDIFHKNNTLSYSIRSKEAKKLINTEPFMECIKKANLFNLKPQLIFMGILAKGHCFWIIDKIIKIIY